MVKAAGGFFAVRTGSGEEYHCKARGVLKRGNSALMVGDRVVFKPDQGPPGASGREGVIEKLIPRKNRINRPPVSNIDQLVIIMALKDPECDWQLVSRMLVLAEKENLKSLVCLNKVDLLDQENLNAIFTKVNHYPYPLIFTSAKTGSGLDILNKVLKGKCSVFAGPSGVGKSSLLNAIQPGLKLQTGKVSDKIRRGKHTTRQAELLALDNGGSVVDTPGFTRIDFHDLEQNELSSYFPEFEPLLGQCGFRNCRHLTEPKCAVAGEVGNSINLMRYEHYKYFADELSKGEVY